MMSFRDPRKIITNKDYTSHVIICRLIFAKLDENNSGGSEFVEKLECLCSFS